MRYSFQVFHHFLDSQHADNHVLNATSNAHLSRIHPRNFPHLKKHDIPKLNTCILGSPKSDVVQSVGRIFREKACDRTHHPLIIDVIDDFSLFKKQADKRQILYRKMNFKIFMNGEEMKKIPRKKKQKTIYDIDECLL